MNGEIKSNPEMISKIIEIGRLTKIARLPFDMINACRKEFSIIVLKTKARTKGAPS